MNVRLILLLLIFFGSTTLRAQVSEAENVRKVLVVENKDTVAWLRGGSAILGLNGGLLHNWPAGGELASVTVNGFFNGYLTRLYHQQVWTTTIDAGYGLLYAYSNSFIPRKTDDRLDLTSKYGIKSSPHSNLYFSAIFNMKTQFNKGFDYSAEDFASKPTSKFLSPGYFTLAAGLEYREGTRLSVLLSPVAARFIVADRYFTTLSDQGAFGIEYGKTSRFQLGAYLSSRVQLEVNKKLLFRSKLDLYSDYLAKDRTDTLGNVTRRDGPGNIDIVWDNLFSYKFAKFLSISAGLNIVYDNDIPYENTFIDEAGNRVSKPDPTKGLGWLQVRQTMLIGLEYKF